LYGMGRKHGRPEKVGLRDACAIARLE